MTDTADLVIERTLAAPRSLVWTALTTPEHVSKWWAPRPYETPECAIELKPGGRFFTRMIGPDGFDDAGDGCVLEVVAGERFVWTSALAPGFRPNEEGGGFPFTAIITLADAGPGGTLYRAQCRHRNAEDAGKHEAMGFSQGWATVAGQLGEVAASLG